MIDLVHLVWGPLGPAPLRRFLDSYRAHPAGTEHELVIALNGVSRDPADATRRAIRDELQAVEHRLLELPEPVQDLRAYGLAAAQLEHDRVCFCNSYSVILADGWLAHLTAAAGSAGVGIASATGSWESSCEWRRGDLRWWPLQLARLPRDRRDFPRFPNPHVRTNAFVLRRSEMATMGFAEVTDKRSAYLLESGNDGLTRRVIARAERPVVIGRDGVVYDIPDWPASRTFRSAGQENLLVADNQTLDYERSSPRRRRRQSRTSWGDAAP